MEVLELSPPSTVSQEEPKELKVLPSIIRVNAIDVSYNHFFWKYMHVNRPLILTNVSEQWECRLKWTKQKEGGEETVINYEYLRERIPNLKVPIADCNQKFFNSHSKAEMEFYDFLNYWQQKADETKPQESKEQANTNYYLKDWHLRDQMPDYKFYRVPKQFGSDWLNEHLISQGRDDYCFVYFGPNGTWTPFHTDVFGSFSWSTNIVGCKKWLLLPPGEELKLADKLNNLPFEIDEQLLQAKQVVHHIVYQQENEALFVPSGWYHQVWNTTNTISVNHNWFNACNIGQVWSNMCSNMQQVQAEIEDCRQMDNFEEHCQLMLRSCFGMNYFDLLELLEFIVKQRLRLIDEGNNNTSANYKNCNNNKTPASPTTSSQPTSSSHRMFNEYSLNDYHIRYDLKNIQSLLTEMLKDKLLACPSSGNNLHFRCQQLVEHTKRF